MKEVRPELLTAGDVEDDSDRADDAVIGRAFRRSLIVAAALAAAIGGLMWWLTSAGPKPVLRESVVELPEVRDRPQAEPPQVVFRDVTEEAGLSFFHENGAYGDKLLPETMGSGCAFLDFDGDGDQDILLVNSCRWPWDPQAADRSSTMCLFRNDGRGRFSDVTKEAGLLQSFYGTGVAVGDYDNDGRVDLYIAAVGPDHLFHNVGGRFVEVTQEAGVAGGAASWGSSCAWFDYNNDGRLDLFVANYVRWSKETDLKQDFNLDGIGRAYGPPLYFQGDFPYLYRNDGQGRFTDVSRKSGIQVTHPYTGVPVGKSLGLSPIDLDADGWMDLVVANDTVQNFVFHNEQDGTFREVGATVGVAFDSSGNARGAMGIDAAYFRNDSSLGIAIGNFANEMSALYVSQDVPMQFVDAAVATGLGPPTRLQLTFGFFFFDYDLDRRLDLLAANGHLERDINHVQASQYYAQPPHLFWNGGADQTPEFVSVPAEKCGADLVRPLVARGSAFADIDGDGDLDVLLTAVADQPRLLRNDQQLGHHWLRFVLQGTRSNRDAIGAWIEVSVDGEILRRQVMPTRSYLSQSELPVTIGLGKSTAVDKVVVRWPDGQLQQVTDFAIDRLTVLKQP